MVKIGNGKNRIDCFPSVGIENRSDVGIVYEPHTFCYS